MLQEGDTEPGEVAAGQDRPQGLPVIEHPGGEGLPYTDAEAALVDVEQQAVTLGHGSPRMASREGGLLCGAAEEEQRESLDAQVEGLPLLPAAPD